MSEDTIKTNETEVSTKGEQVESKSETKVEQKMFNQEQLDNIVQQRLLAEKKKHERVIEEESKAKNDLLKAKELEEAKTKSDLEKIMQDRISEKDGEINKYKSQIKKEKIDNAILSVASNNQAISPEQVVALLKGSVKLNDDGRIEVLDKNGNIRYNPKGELLSIEENVKEFLDTNQHFRMSTNSGSGSKAAIGGYTPKPFNLADIDLSTKEGKASYAEYRKARDSKATKIGS